MGISQDSPGHLGDLWSKGDVPLHKGKVIARATRYDVGTGKGPSLWQYLDLAGVPILIHTVRAFLKADCIEEIVVVVPKERIDETQQLLDRHIDAPGTLSVIAGGKRRQDSVLAGLKNMQSGCEIVLVHDGARPLVSAELIHRLYQAAQKQGAAIAAVPVKDTLKKAGPDLSKYL